MMSLYKPKFHLAPPTGWLNDPNGLCLVENTRHIFFQYTPDNPYGGNKYWGHYETEDFVNYKYTGIFLSPDIKEDINGVFSGSAYVEDDTMYIYYTGNVEHPGNFDYIREGREGNTLLVTSKDGIVASEKRCILRNSDYPSSLSNHVRDPKVFFENGSYYMVLGCRTLDDQGRVMLYVSEDKVNWQFKRFLYKENFGYMWECPDLFSLEGQQYLSLSPQGLTSEEYKYQNIYQSGYFSTKENLLENDGVLGDFTEWDYGFDFYAPQTYEDKGRRILIGWMGVPGVDYDHDPTIDDGWQHMLTMPRELKVDKSTGRITQKPIDEMKKLRKSKVCDTVSIGKNLLENSSNATFEIVLENLNNALTNLQIHEGFEITYNPESKVFLFTFTDDDLGFGRTQRKIKLEEKESFENITIYIDTCCVEIYINDGAYVFTTKIFKDTTKKASFRISEGQIGNVTIYELADFEIKK